MKPNKGSQLDRFVKIPHGIKHKLCQYESRPGWRETGSHPEGAAEWIRAVTQSGRSGIRGEASVRNSMALARPTRKLLVQVPEALAYTTASGEESQSKKKTLPPELVLAVGRILKDKPKEATKRQTCHDLAGAFGIHDKEATAAAGAAAAVTETGRQRQHQSQQSPACLAPRGKWRTRCCTEPHRSRLWQ